MERGLKVIVYGIVLVIVISCETEKCQINYERDFEIYEKAVRNIYLNLEMNGNEPYHRIIKSIKSNNGILDTLVFDKVELVECYKDLTIIFQAYNCQEESLLRDKVYILSYSPKGLVHLKEKRNISKMIEVRKNWFYGSYIKTIAN